MADDHQTTVTCPHCGDVTQQDMLLDEFTCGKCDRPFSSPAHTAYRRGKSAGYSVGLIDGWDACMRQVGDAFDRAVAVALTEPEAVRKHRDAVLAAQRGKEHITND